MLWVALHVPQLSLQCFAAAWLAGVIKGDGHGPGLDQGAAPWADPSKGSKFQPWPPIAVMAQHRIVQLNDEAQILGLKQGMKRSTAMALAPNLVFGQADPNSEQQAMLALAHAAMAYTPMVVLGDSNTVWLELNASLRLFGGWPRLAQSLLATAVAALPMARTEVALGLKAWPGAPANQSSRPLQAAAAPTATSADWLSRWARAEQENLLHGEHVQSLQAMLTLLAQAPVHLPRTQGSAALMQSLGVQRLGELLKLPRAGLARRVSPELLLECDRALGRAPHPLQPLQWPATFEAQLELHHRADSAQALVGAAQLLLSQALAWASARMGQIGRIELHLVHEKARHAQTGSATLLSIELAQASADAAHWRLLLAERLGRLQLAAPCIALRLHCAQCIQAAPPNAELFPGPQAQQLALARLLERLSAGLQEGQIAKLQALKDHRPEHAQALVPVDGVQPAARAASVPAKPIASSTGLAHRAPATGPNVDAGVDSAIDMPVQRPAWLVQPAVALAQRAGRPVWQGQSLQVISGPERIEAGWWDAQLATRDYFIAQARDGSLLWLWRERLPQRSDAEEGSAQHAGVGVHAAQAKAGPWMLQGLFA